MVKFTKPTKVINGKVFIIVTHETTGVKTMTEKEAYAWTIGRTITSSEG